MKMHLRATTRGADQVDISLGGSTNNTWNLEQILVHCHATFTDPSTFKVYFRCHEGTAYDTMLLQSSVSTVNGVLNDIFWQPDRPINLTGKDRICLVFSGVSSGLPWAYDAVVSEG